MTYKQQEKAFTSALKTMDKQWVAVTSSNIDDSMINDIIDLVTKNFVSSIQNIFPTATNAQVTYIINEHFNHVIEIKFEEFYSLLNNIEIINKVR